MPEEEKRASRRMWRTASGYGQRVGVERCFSSLKRIFGDRASPKSRAAQKHARRGGPCPAWRYRVVATLAAAAAH